MYAGKGLLKHIIPDNVMELTIHGNIKEIVVLEEIGEVIFIAGPSQTVTMDLPFRLRREDFLGWLGVAKIRVVSRISIITSVYAVIAVAVVIVGLTVTTEAAHDSLVVAGFNGGKA